MAKAAVDLTVTGADKLAKLAAALKEAGHEDLRKELGKAMGRAARPLKAAARAGAAQGLPYRGGLAERVATSRFTSRTRTTGRNVGVRIVGASDMDLKAMNRGRLKHPVHGNRRVWVTQQIPPGWFTNSQLIEVPAVRAELVKAIDAVARKLKERAT
jgi:hypothetical protein